MDTQQGLAAWTCSVNMQHGHATWTSSMDICMGMWHRQAAWTWAWTCGKDMQIYISKTCSKGIRYSIDMGMQHRNSADKSGKDMQLGNTAWTCSVYIRVA
jgi:hypothetical protein